MTLPASYFDAMYAQAGDPWGFESRWYEQRKYAITMASLPRIRFRRGFEPGCSVGVLTEQLAARCGELLATDVASSAVSAARQRVAHLPNVAVEQRSVPDEWPVGSFDLIVLSEIGYYLSTSALSQLVSCATSALDNDGVLIAVHWRHPVEDYPLSGDEVHGVLRRDGGLRSLVRHVEDDFVLEVLGATGAKSVAAETGLVP